MKRSCKEPACDALTGPNCEGKWQTGLVAKDCDDALAAVRPGVIENCATLYDDNCNGTEKDTCDCQKGDPPLSCGVPGDCNYQPKGSACNEETGKYSTCPAALEKVEYCPDGDKDGFCATAAGSCGFYCPPGAVNPEQAIQPPTGFIKRELCANASTGKTDCADGDAAIFPSAAELCGDGVDTNCAAVGADADSDTYNLGGTCTVVAGASEGACLNGGNLICSSAGSDHTFCKKDDLDIGSTKAQTKAAPNKSFDWNCDGEVTVSHQLYTSTSKGGADCKPSGPPLTFALSTAVQNTTQWTNTNILVVTGADPECASFSQTNCRSGETRFYSKASRCEPSPRYPCGNGACETDLLPLRCLYDASMSKCYEPLVFFPCKPKSRVTTCN